MLIHTLGERPAVVKIRRGRFDVLAAIAALVNNKKGESLHFRDVSPHFMSPHFVISRRFAQRSAYVAIAMLFLACSATIRAVHVQVGGPLTFADDVAPILFDRCVSCHHPDGPAPFSLISYSDAKQRASLIAKVTASRYMPPWKSEPGSGEFVGQKALSESEIDTIQQWVSDGAPEGDTTHLRAPVWTKGWQLGTPDLVVTLPEPYTLRSDGADVWRVFVFPVPVRSVQYVKGLEFRPGGAKVVHHARIRLDRTPASRRLDDQDPAPGYEGFIARSALYPDGHFLGWTPGQTSPLLPKGLAWRLDPGVDLVVEVHMVPSGKVEKVDPSIGLYFGSDPPERTPAILRLGRKNLDIPAGEKAYVSADSFVLPIDVEVRALQPHAHYRARQVTSIATLPDGTRQTLLSIKDWDVRWQHLYQYVTPIVLPKGTTIAMQFTFDNSADNPRNPQLPPARVFWGEESIREMGELWIQMLPRNDRDLRALLAAIEPKMVNEDTIGYEMRLRQDPTKVLLHDEAGDAYLYLGRPADAVRHFEASLGANPGSASAHYNLGVALAETGDLEGAIRLFRRAVELKPDYALAHNNLGSALTRLGKTDEGLEHFRTAIRLDPNDAGAYHNAATVLHARGELSEAVRHFRRAVELKPDWILATSNLAWILATAPSEDLRNAADATRLAERAVALSERADASVLDVLAAAYASAGEFDRALAVLGEALALKPNARVSGTIRQHMALYKRHERYVLPLPAKGPHQGPH